MLAEISVMMIIFQDDDHDDDDQHDLLGDGDHDDEYNCDDIDDQDDTSLNSQVMDIKMPAKTELMYGNTQRFQRQTSQVGWSR